MTYETRSEGWHMGAKGIMNSQSLPCRLFCWKRECSLPYKISVYQSASFGVMFYHCDVLIVEKGLHIPHTLGI